MKKYFYCRDIDDVCYALMKFKSNPERYEESPQWKLVLNFSPIFFYIDEARDIVGSDEVLPPSTKMISIPKLRRTEKILKILQK